jgi:hypothetical protein
LNFLKKYFPWGRKDFLVVLVWGVILGIVICKVYWVGYQEIKWLSVYKVPYGWYETPNPKPLDLMLVLFVSIIFGALISSMKGVFYGYLIGMILAFSVGFIFVIFYMWRVLQLEYLFMMSDFNWEWAVFFALLNVGRILFPYIILISLLGVIIGMLIRERLNY